MISWFKRKPKPKPQPAPNPYQAFYFLLDGVASTPTKLDGSNTLAIPVTGRGTSNGVTAYWFLHPIATCKLEPMNCIPGDTIKIPVDTIVGGLCGQKLKIDAALEEINKVYKLFYAIQGPKK